MTANPGPSVPLHPPRRSSQPAPVPSQLPTILQTPAGLAILELQGTINLPAPEADADAGGSGSGSGKSGHSRIIPIGRLEFPDYKPGDDDGDPAWMKRVTLFVGQHQRLAGEVKKLPKALGVVRRRRGVEGAAEPDDADELEVVEVIKYKLSFAQRPEPVGTT